MIFMKNALAITIAVSILASPALAAPDANVYDYYEQAESAYKKQDYPAFLENAEAAHALEPAHPAILYLLARAYAVQGNSGKALQTLSRAVAIGGLEALEAEKEKDFSPIKTLPAFQDILKEIAAKKIPVQTSETAFVIPEKTLVPEGTAYDPATRTLFISSINRRKIVAIGPNGEIRDFVGPRQDGIGAVGGIEVDTACGCLWAATWFSFPGSADPEPDPGSPKTGIFKFDLNTGKLIKKYLMELPGEHGFNDIAISSKGDAYITDTAYGAVYRIKPGTDRLELFIEPRPDRRFHNGIAITPDDHYLFVAHAMGIDIVDLRTGKEFALPHPGDTSLADIDGLSFHKGSLIAHQGSALRAINRYYLSPDMKRVVRKEIIDSHRPEFNSPTTGAVAGDDYYYIANSQLRGLDKGKEWPEDRFKDVIILKSRL